MATSDGDGGPAAQRAREFRFGVGLMDSMPRPKVFAEQARRAEELGYDVVVVPDAIQYGSPLPALVAAAHATERIRLGTTVMNVMNWHPRTLVRELASLDQHTGGRLEIGLGTGLWRLDGVVKSAKGERLARLQETVAELELAAAGEYPGIEFAQSPRPPLHLVGVTAGVFALAGAHAQTYGLTVVNRPRPGVKGIGMLTAEEATEQAQAVNEAAGARAAEIEICVSIHLVDSDDKLAAAAQIQRDQAPHLTVEQVLESPKLAFGSPEQIAATIRASRGSHGISFRLVQEQFLERFAPVIALARAS